MIIMTPMTTNLICRFPNRQRGRHIVKETDMKQYKDLTGMRFGSLIVLNLDHKEPKYRIYKKTGNKNKVGYVFFYKCLCDCGKEKIIRNTHLEDGRTKSCGCGHKGHSGTTIIHGFTGTRLHHIWIGMKERCRDKRIKNYGGRWITVCKEWVDDFLPFMNWANQNGYRDDLTIDRIDVNGNYCPENCRWVDMKAQSRNKRTNHVIEINGKRRCIAEWCEMLGLNYKKEYKKISKNYEYLKSLVLKSGV